MSLQQVTIGCLRKLNAGHSNSVESLGFAPVVQIKEIKAIGASGNLRYRVMLNDGDDLLPGIVASNCVQLIQENHIIDFSLVRLTNFNVNNAVANQK